VGKWEEIFAIGLEPFSLPIKGKAEKYNGEVVSIVLLILSICQSIE
jgi:hypothetical protein